MTIGNTFLWNVRMVSFTEFIVLERIFAMLVTGSYMATGMLIVHPKTGSSTGEDGDISEPAGHYTVKSISYRRYNPPDMYYPHLS